MNPFFNVVNRAVSYGLVGGPYSCTRAVSVYELAQANEAADRERSELIAAIIKILESTPSESSNHSQWERFYIAMYKADALVDSIPHNIPRAQ